MANKIRKKDYKDANVFDASIERIRYIYDSFDKVIVSFSGGKDSTAVLNMTLEVAREKNRLPLDVVFFDEEAVHPTTIEYVERTRQNPDIRMHWYCLEFKHRNACSNEQPFWYTWDNDKKDLWVRNLPDNVITEHPKFKKGMSFQEFSPFLYERKDGKIAMLTGIRTEESMRRYQVIARKKNDAFIQAKSECANNQYRAFPIYDWSSQDVWLAVHKLGWDYNKTYDIFNQTRLYGKFLTQRVCPPFGEEPIRGLWVYAECFPEMWHKMLNRVEGVATAWRYANTELYSNANDKPENMTYQQYLDIILDSYDFDSQKDVRTTIAKYVSMHKKKSKQQISDEECNPLTGLSWKLLCRVAMRGDFKGRQSSVFQQSATKERDKLGITLEEAIKLYS
jgi:predicted phosphoadenosine phosphosulfate sulfurtransferase